MSLLIVFLELVLCWVLKVQSRVFEVYTQDHLHDLLQDTPMGNRPAVAIAFYNDTAECQKNLRRMSFDDHNLPGMQHLILAKYELSGARERVWHDYEDHLDLVTNLGINKYISSQESCECPIIAYLPVEYANYVGEYYRNQPPINDTSLNLISFYDINAQQKYSNWKMWLWSQMKTKIKIISKEPFNFEITIVPNSGRVSIFEEENINVNKDYIIQVNAFESETLISDNIYIGDQIFISNNPIYPHEEAEIASRPTALLEKGDSLRPTSDAPNPMYDVYGIDYWIYNHNEPNFYFIKRLNDGRYGFDISMKKDNVQLNRNLIKKRHSTTCMTHTRNLCLPTALDHIHKQGFKKRKMPAGLHDRLLRFYRQWYHRKAVEGWDKTGTQLNFIDVKSHMISLDHNFKERNSIAEDVIKPILEEWSGKELEFTAFYGLREYSDGAVLRNHVDRVETHVVSAILQIAQTGLHEPWQLEVVGFDGHYYKITLQPGEMALYEGHALIHGRPKPFNGTIFTNAFVHFKPKDWNLRTSDAWRHPNSQAVLKKLHVRLQDLYR